jgi:hypothetical protein
VSASSTARAAPEKVDVVESVSALLRERGIVLARGRHALLGEQLAAFARFDLVQESGKEPSADAVIKAAAEWLDECSHGGPGGTLEMLEGLLFGARPRRRSGAARVTMQDQVVERRPGGRASPREQRAGARAAPKRAAKASPRPRPAAAQDVAALVALALERRPGRDAGLIAAAFARALEAEQRRGRS